MCKLLNTMADQKQIEPIDCSVVTALIHTGTLVTLTGWVANVRQSGKIKFINLRDFTPGLLPCVLAADVEVPTVESSIRITGIIKRDDRAKGGVELKVSYWKLIGSSNNDIKSRITRDSTVPTLLDNRHLVIRQQTTADILRARSKIINCFRTYLLNNDFTEVTCPSIVTTQVEGGSTLFSLKYYGINACLTQSSQLYLETAMVALGGVFCIQPSYRAEKSHTRRHLSEYDHAEVEIPHISTTEELCCKIEKIVYAITTAAAFYDVVQRVNPYFIIPQIPFRRMNYVDAIEYLNANEIYKDKSNKVPFILGDDIPEGPERRMIDMIGEPILLCRFPTNHKPFYMKKCSDEIYTESVDLLVPGVGEIIGGSIRETDYDIIINRLKSDGIDPILYYWYTDLRKYGSIPHGGYGLGIERLLMWILKQDHIRNVCLYPRFEGRCTP